MTAGTFGWLLSHAPTSADWTELGIAPIPERPAPVIPLTVGTAVIKAYKRFDLTAERAVDLLHGTVAEEDLPLPNPIPLEALTSEL